MASSRVWVALVSAAFALVLVRCSSFSSDDTANNQSEAGEGGNPSEASAEASPVADGQADADPGDASVDARPAPINCAQFQDAGVADSGFYGVDGGQLYCDMATAGGGWTLVARSASGAADVGPFGWKVSSGTDDTTGSQYSLDARRIGSFTSLLFGQVGPGNVLVNTFYTKTVPADFLTKYGDAGLAEPTVTVLGCNPGGDGPQQLNWVGFTDETDHYFFHDNSLLNAYGLRPNGWSVSNSLCLVAGDLFGVQAAIFVR